MPSTSAKQHRFMQAIAHSPSFAKKVGVSQSVGKDFTAADKGKTFNKGGMMKKRRFDEGGEIDYEVDENAEPERRSFGSGVSAKNREYNEPTAKTPAKPALKNYGDEKDSGPKEDTRGVGGMASRKYVYKGTDADKERNATNLAKELATTAALGGVGKLGQAVYRVGKAANVARHFGEAKQLAAPEAAAWKEFAATPRKAIKTPSAKKFEKQINSGEIALKKGGDVKNLFKGKETYGEELKEAKAIKSGKISPKQYAMGEKSEEKMKKGGMPMKDGKPSFMAKYAKGGSIRRMADGGMTAPMAPPMAPQAPVDPRQMAAMQAAMQAQRGAPMPPPAPGMKRGGSVRFAKGGGIESRGKTKGTIIRMASGGSVSSASRRADGIAQRGKTRC